ncbi:MAG: type I-E CRISPR-associated protein Cas5/CasD [Pyrinomonadaceae bacterium MAG19_C2-C3]|nr:type I-E CRISPR-associated protein Cas5/CasD [Pyrinomonadaceae bacterium MAG19_C2-C3]
MPTTLLMQLAGPMQSWGFRSRFDNRDTGLEPTRSGVIGLLCAALGRGRDTDLREFESLRMGVRVDAAGRIAVDYHTAQPVWRGSTATTVSNRYYLADARFLVALQSDEVAWLQDIEAALRNPMWSLFLGRKSFVPSLPLHLETSGLREGEVERVLKTEAWRWLSEIECDAVGISPHLRLVLETDKPRDGVATNDAPRDFARRRYGSRYLRTDFCQPPTARHPLAEEPRFKYKRNEVSR